MTFVSIPEKEWTAFCAQQAEILALLRKVKPPAINTVIIKYITAKEFMDAVRIKRTKFDTLVQTNAIKIVKKERKIYVPVEEVGRYFERTQ